MPRYSVTLVSEGPFVQTMTVDAEDEAEARAIAEVDCDCNRWLPASPFYDFDVEKVEVIP